VELSLTGVLVTEFIVLITVRVQHVGEHSLADVGNILDWKALDMNQTTDYCYWEVDDLITTLHLFQCLQSEVENVSSLVDSLGDLTDFVTISDLIPEWHDTIEEILFHIIQHCLQSGVLTLDVMTNITSVLLSHVVRQDGTLDTGVELMLVHCAERSIITTIGSGVRVGDETSPPCYPEAVLSNITPIEHKVAIPATSESETINFLHESN
jgi:hypothetical protein